LQDKKIFKKKTLSRDDNKMVRKVDKDQHKIEKLLDSNLEDLKGYISDLRTFLPVPICYINPVNIILDINESFERLFHYGETEIIGEKLEKLFAYPQEAEEIEKEISRKERIQNRETIFLTKERKEIPVSISLMQRKDKDGNFIGYFLSIADLREMKRIQNELQEKIEEMEKFHKLTIGREEKILELKEKIRRLEEELEELKKSKK